MKYLSHGDHTKVPSISISPMTSFQGQYFYFYSGPPCIYSAWFSALNRNKLIAFCIESSDYLHYPTNIQSYHFLNLKNFGDFVAKAFEIKRLILKICEMLMIYNLKQDLKIFKSKFDINFKKFKVLKNVYFEA